MSKTSKTLALGAKLVNTLSRDKAYVALRAIPLSGGAVQYLADCEVNRDYCTYHFHLNCGKPTAQTELWDNFLAALDRFVRYNDKDSLAEEYFCDHADDPLVGRTHIFRDAIEHGDAISAAIEDMLVSAKQVLKGGDGRKTDHRPILDRVVEAARHYICCIDDEMEICDYKTSDVVPSDYEGEDYFKDCEDAVNKAVDARKSLEEAIYDAHIPL